jgi:NADH-quinone oxidoreductase subunit J
VAQTPEKPSRHIEVFAGAVLLILTVGFVFFMIAKTVLPGLAPVAGEGAQLAKPGDLVFYALAGLTMVSAGGVAFSRNIIYSALALLGTLLGAGSLYVYLGADYVAVTQLLVYVGGVLVLILFAVMLTSKIGDRKHSNPSVGFFPGLVLLVALLAVLGYVATQSPWLTAPKASAPADTALAIGDAFLREYLLPFEVSSLVLLATLIGAVVVARKEIKE